jgi:hypothetical protein
LQSYSNSKYDSKYDDVKDPDDDNNPIGLYAVCNYCYAANVTNPLKNGKGRQPWDTWLTASRSTSQLQKHMVSHHPQLLKEKNDALEKVTNALKEYNAVLEVVFKNVDEYEKLCKSLNYSNYREIVKKEMILI